jgi:multiple sugar transport system substrate-binding protein
MSNKASRTVSRRDMLKLLGMSSAGLALSACSPNVVVETREVEVPVEVPVEQTVEVQVEQTVVVKETVEVEAAPSGPLYEEGELTLLLCCYTPEVLDLQADYNADFEKTYPGVKISQQETPAGQNYFEKLQTLIAAGTPPDVFDMWEGYVQPYAENNALMNLSPYIDLDPDIDWDDLQPAATEAASWGGNLYALIRDFYPGPGTLFYNTDLFDAAGVPYPTSDYTWDNVRAAAADLTVDTNGDGVPDEYGLGYETWFVPWLFWIWSNGGSVFNDDDTACTLTDPKSVEAIQYWADMMIEDEVALPPSTADALQGVSNAFMTGAVAMFIGNTWNIQELLAAREQGLNWKACLAPSANDGRRVYYMHLECWAASADTEKPDTAWRYIRDYQDKAVSRFVQLYPGIPHLKEKLYLYMTPENAEYGWDRIPSIISDPNNIRIPGAGAKWDKISGMIQAELDLVFIGEKTAEEAAAAVCPQIDEELARA